MTGGRCLTWRQRKSAARRRPIRATLSTLTAAAVLSVSLAPVASAAILEDDPGSALPPPLPPQPPSLPSPLPTPPTPTPDPTPSGGGGGDSLQVPEVTSPVTKTPSTPQSTHPDGGGVPAPGTGTTAGPGPGWPPAEGFVRPPADTGPTTAGPTDAGTGSGAPGGEQTVQARPEAPAGSIDVAGPAPLGRLLAYVWPAVALGRVAGAFLPLLSGLDGSIGHLASGFPLFSVAGAAIADVAGAATPGSPADGSGQSTQERAGPPLDSLSSGGMGLATLLVTGLLGLVGAVAVARLLVGEELFSPRRWWGHRGL
jgi:hypothetical protein